MESVLPKIKATSLHLGRDTGALVAGSGLTLLALFLPWFRAGGISVSGWDLSLAGYGFLWAVPLFGLLAAWLSKANPDARPAALMLPGVLGALCLFLLFSMVVNYDDGALALVRDRHVQSHLRLDLHGETHRITGIGNTAGGLHLTLVGLLLICTGPLLHPSVRPRNGGDSTPEVCSRGDAVSLEALRDGRTRRHELKVAAGCLLGGCILIFTYTWCGMSPAKLWENRGNAREYLFGRDLSESDMRYIEEQSRRAPDIEAQGRAREFQDNRYRSVPVEEQPGLEEKMKENEALVQKYLDEMTETEKTELRERAYADALQEKQGGYFPPETAWPRLKGYIVALLETVAIAIWGTLLAVICAVPAALFAARNTLGLIVPGEGRTSRALRWFSVFGVRRFLDACRGFNEFVMALIFVAVIGLGPYAGILALWIHTFGILGKVFSEQIEAIDPAQVEALSSTGASVDQTIAFSVLPQVMPGFVSYTLLRFESNVRSATVLGFVGAGGIGFLIFDKLNGYLFREVCTMMIIIIIAVGVIDFLCGKLRSRFI
jgi:phosphonate transport system permease protein